MHQPVNMQAAPAPDESHTTAPDRQMALEMYRRIVRIRRLEEQVMRLVKAGAETAGPYHLYTGEEAVAVGACMALRDDDYITGTHRSHGHPIAKGGDLRKAMAELLGKRTGYCKGKGGSMHLADFSIGVLGESGIVGSAMPTAVGAALGSKLQGTDRVVVCFFGDGAVNAGPFHETLNLASIWKLPVIFVCENNKYAITSAALDMMAVPEVAVRASCYAMPGVEVDGQNAVAVHAAVSTAVGRARAGYGPSLIEARTYRYDEHSVGLQRIVRSPYRTGEELAEWHQRDPLVIHRNWVLEHSLATETELDEIETEVREAIIDALGFARESPFPEPAELFDDMYAEPIDHR